MWGQCVLQLAYRLNQFSRSRSQRWWVGAKANPRIVKRLITALSKVRTGGTAPLVGNRGAGVSLTSIQEIWYLGCHFAEVTFAVRCRSLSTMHFGPLDSVKTEPRAWLSPTEGPLISVDITSQKDGQWSPVGEAVYRCW